MYCLLNLPPTSVVKETTKDLKNASNMNCKFFETSDDVPDPRYLNSEKKNLMMFDALQLG